MGFRGRLGAWSGGAVRAVGWAWSGAWSDLVTEPQVLGAPQFPVPEEGEDLPHTVPAVQKLNPGDATEKPDQVRGDRHTLL